MDKWPDLNDPTKDFKPDHTIEVETDGSVDVINRTIYEMQLKGWFYWISYWPVDKKHLVLSFWKNDEPPPFFRFVEQSMETDWERAQRHLHNQDRIIDELHAKHKAALLLLKEFVHTYMQPQTDEQLAGDLGELINQAIEMLHEEQVEGFR